MLHIKISKLFKKLLNKIHWAMYNHYQRKAHKYWFKIIGAKKYKPEKLSKSEKDYIKCDINSLYGLSVYAGTDSVNL